MLEEWKFDRERREEMKKLEIEAAELALQTENMTWKEKLRPPQTDLNSQMDRSTLVSNEHTPNVPQRH